MSEYSICYNSVETLSKHSISGEERRRGRGFTDRGLMEEQHCRVTGNVVIRWWRSPVGSSVPAASGVGEKADDQDDDGDQEDAVAGSREEVGGG